jgi:hypothetical protein
VTPDEIVKGIARSTGEWLRARGYRGTNRNWRFVDDGGNAVLVNLQRSRSSTADVVRFTVNVAVVNRRLWVWEYEDLADRRKPDVWSGHWRARPAGDHWWVVSAETDAQLVATDVRTRLEPLLTQAHGLLRDEALALFWQTGWSGGLLPRQIDDYRRVLSS